MSRTRALTLTLGLNQLITWGTSFYLPAVIGASAAADLGARPALVIGGVSWALLLAGLCAPRIGRRIDRLGGRGVLAASAVVTALGLVILAGSHDLPLWYAGWAVLGLGMALGLYDAAFATAGHLLGTAASPVITGVTLIAGFASSLFWPAGAGLVAAIGWRGTLLAYAGLQLAVNLPLVLLAVPAAPAAAGRARPAAIRREPGPVRRRALGLLGGFFTLRWLISSAIAVYVLTILGGLGLAPREAVIVAALIGPGQVAGRLLEWRLAPRLGILARARLGATLLPLGVAMLAAAGPVAAPGFALLYGMSNGILTINRGTLPLALFGPSGYATLLGWLAVPVLLAQATAPTLAAPLIEALPARDVVLAAGAIAAVAALLLAPLRIRPEAQNPPASSR